MMDILLPALVLLIVPFLVHLGVSTLPKSRENLQNNISPSPNTACSSSNQGLSATVSDLTQAFSRKLRSAVSRLLHNPSSPTTHQSNEHTDPLNSHVIDMARNGPSSDVSASQPKTVHQFSRTHSLPNTASGIGTAQQPLPDHSSSDNRKIDSSAFPDDARLYKNYTTRLGFQCHVIDIRMLQRDQIIGIMEDRGVVATAPTKSLLGKTTFGVTYQAATGLMIFYYQSLPSSSSSSATGHNGGNNSSTVHYAPLPLPIRIISIVTVIGFSASLVGILLHKQHPVLAAIAEKLGSASAALGFFITMSILLSGISQLIGWFAASVSFIAFAYAVFKLK